MNHPIFQDPEFVKAFAAGCLFHTRKGVLYAMRRDTKTLWYVWRVAVGSEAHAVCNGECDCLAPKPCAHELVIRFGSDSSSSLHS